MSTYILWFMLYAFGGWLWEVVFNRVFYARWRLHGYLTLPLLPIYGFSAIGIALVAQPYLDSPPLVFMVAAGVVTLLEYVTSWTLERVFRVNLWDYSDWPLNLQGRVSLPSSLGFGFMGLVVVYALQPWLGSMVEALPSLVAAIGAYILLGAIVIDFLNATASLARVRFDGKWELGTLDDLQLYIEGRLAKLRKGRHRLKVALEKWHRRNIRHLRRAYPRAKTVPRENKRKSM